MDESNTEETRWQQHLDAERKKTPTVGDVVNFFKQMDKDLKEQEPAPATASEKLKIIERAGGIIEKSFNKLLESATAPATERDHPTVYKALWKDAEAELADVRAERQVIVGIRNAWQRQVIELREQLDAAVEGLEEIVVDFNRGQLIASRTLDKIAKIGENK